MKRIIAALLLIVMSALALSGCQKEGPEVPEDMQLVLENKEEGYIFFGPKGWIIANQGDVAATFLSNFNRTSITFTGADMPTERDSEGKVDFGAYFDATMADFPYAVTGISRESVNFGTADRGADRAMSFVYSYTADEDVYTTKQILLTRGEDFFIFTYTAPGSSDDEAAAYRTYLPKANLVIENFIFTDKSTVEKEEGEIITDSDGYVLSSDASVCGFELYLPRDYELYDKSTIVSAKITSGANISLTRATETGLGVLDYLLNRRADISEICDSFTDIKIGVAKAVNTESEYFDDWELSILPEYDEGLKFGDLTEKGNIVSYEYTYTHGGNTYHVYQVIGANNFYGYVFTYTALEGEYEEHLDEVVGIIEKVKF